MVSTGPRTIVLSLVAVLAIAAAPNETRAGSYGHIDAFVVRQKIKKDLPKINRCYESALRYEPQLAGKVSVRFAVVRTGYVKGVQVVENTTGNEKVERCVTRVLSAIRFPAAEPAKAYASPSHSSSPPKPPTNQKGVWIRMCAGRAC